MSAQKTIAVFGGSGRTGSEVIRLAVNRGWLVRALVRPASACEPRPGLQIIRGDLQLPSDVQKTVAGMEAVVCVFGPRSTAEAPFCATATGHVIAAMESTGVRRLAGLTGAMVGDLPPTVSVAMRSLAGLYRRQVPALAADAAAQERVIIESGLDWTLVKPGRLTDRAATGRVQAGPSVRIGLLSPISRRDLARFILDELCAGRHVRERVYIRAA